MPDYAHIRFKYKVTASITDESLKDEKMKFKPMYAKRPVIITANELSKINIDRKITLESKVKTMFFVKKGSARVEVTFNKDAFEFGETALAECIVDNRECEKDVKKIKFKLKRLIYAVAKDKFKLKYNDTLAEAEFPGVEAGQMRTQNLDLVLKFDKYMDVFQKYLDK